MVKAYVALTKPRIIELLLVTTLPAMFLAAGGFPPWRLVLWTLIGGLLAAASANTFNCVLDADIAKARAAGFVGYVTKPLDLPSFLARLDAFFAVFFSSIGWI